MTSKQIKTKAQKISTERQVALKIKSLMKQNRIRERQIAERLGVAQCTISYRLSSGYRWSVRELMEIAPMLNVAPEELIAVAQATVASNEK